MLIPNQVGVWMQLTGYNLYGEPIWGPSTDVPCSIVSMKPKLAKTPIRSEASASHSASDEEDSLATILVSASAPVGIGDRFEVVGEDFRFITVQQRFDILGDLDHYQCECEAWFLLEQAP